MYRKQPDQLAFVRERLAATSKPVRKIAEEAEVGASWLFMFKKGRIPNPGYQQIHRLAEYFAREREAA